MEVILLMPPSWEAANGIALRNITKSVPTRAAANRLNNRRLAAPFSATPATSRNNRCILVASIRGMIDVEEIHDWSVSRDCDRWDRRGGFGKAGRKLLC